MARHKHTKQTKIHPVLGGIHSFFYLLFLSWIIFFYYIFFWALKADPESLQYQLGEMLYNDRIMIYVFAFMFLWTCIITRGKDRILRILATILFGVFIYANFVRFGYIYRKSNVLIMALLIFSANVNDQLIMSCSLIIQTVISALRVYFSAIGRVWDKGWVWSQVLVQNYGRGDVEERYRFGYPHPNGAHLAFFVYLTTWLYLLRKSKLRFLFVIAGAVGNVYLYRYTASRGGFLGISVLLICYLIYPIVFKYFPAILRWLAYLIVQAVPFAITAFMWYICKLNTKEIPWVYKLDRILTGRISYLLEAYRHVPITLLGSNVNTGPLDMKYIQMLLANGLIVFVLYYIVHLFMVHWLYRKGEYAAMAMATAFDVYAMIDGGIISIFHNFNIYLMVFMLCGLHTRANVVRKKKKMKKESEEAVAEEESQVEMGTEEAMEAEYQSVE